MVIVIYGLRLSTRAMSANHAVTAHKLVKNFGDTRAVDGVSLAVPAGSIYGILGPNGAGKTTTIRMLLGIIDPDSGERTLLGRERPLEAAREVGYLPEERGLYPAMTRARGDRLHGRAARPAAQAKGARRAVGLLEGRGLGDWTDKPIRTLSKGMAQTVQLLGTIVHQPHLIVLDEPFSGLDAINQAKLEELIREAAAAGTTVIFSTHVIAHAERLCERVAIIASGKVAFDGAVDEARGRLRPIVHLRTRAEDGPWRPAIPAGARKSGREWTFELPESGPEPLLQRADRRRRRDRDAEHRAARPSRRVRRHRRRGRGGGRWPTTAESGRMTLRDTLSSAFVIGRRDFTATVFSKTFLLFLLGPLIPVAVRLPVRRDRRARRAQRGAADGGGDRRAGGIRDARPGAQAVRAARGRAALGPPAPDRARSATRPPSATGCWRPRKRNCSACSRAGSRRRTSPARSMPTGGRSSRSALFVDEAQRISQAPSPNRAGRRSGSA